MKDAISEADYTEICERSLKQYKSILADETVMNAFVGIEEFKAEWDVSFVCFPIDKTLDGSDFMLMMSYSLKCLAPQSASVLVCPAPP